MHFIPTPLKPAFLIELDRKNDERGFFARSFCAEEFKAKGIDCNFVQTNISFNPLKGTLRGMHYQTSPAEEIKVVRCTRGSLYDVIVDLRPTSTTFKEHFGAELSAENGLSMLVPKGFAHGFITLEDDTEASYMVSAPYTPELERAVLWNDPQFAINWPIAPCMISEKDSSHPLFTEVS